MDGNPIKLDNGGFNVIQSMRGVTTTVPNVVGMSESQAVTVIKARTLKPVTVDRVMNPAPVGTVSAQNSPGGTVEPTGSEVDLSVSLGQTTVPTLVGWDESSAVRAINAAGLAVGQISFISSCLDPGLVQLQNPRGGSLVTPGTSVSMTMATCPSGGGGGPPIHPK
jgi:serine/threonine-protein kinase